MALDPAKKAEAPDLAAKVKEAIESHAKELAEDEIKRAVADFERHLRELVGKVAIAVGSYYSIQRLGTDLVITVKLGGKDGG